MKPIPLTYSYNWNNKLACPVHTTVRLWNEKKYFRGAMFEEFLKGEYVQTVTVVDVKRIKLSQVNDYIAGLDTGYLVPEFETMIRKMYQKKVTDWTQQELAFILLKRIDNLNN